MPVVLLSHGNRAVLGVPIEQPPPRVALTAGKAALIAQGISESLFERIPTGDGVFRAQLDSTFRFTFTLEGGKATGFTVVQHGATMHASRVNDGER